MADDKMETMRHIAAPGMTQPQSRSATGEQRFVLADPSIYILDCGCWTSHLMTLGAIAGSQLVLCWFKEVDQEGAAQAGQVAVETVVGQLCSKLREFIVPLLSFTISEDWRAHSPVRMHLELHETGTTHGAEYNDKSQLFTEPGQLVVFVPDTHIGLRDQADNFARNPGRLELSVRNYDNLLKNGRILAHVLEVAKRCGAKVIQTGDFFDIWEGEAESKIYYSKESFPAELRRDRTERARLAATKIHYWWGASSDEYNQILASIDQFLLGNHDIEMLHLTQAMLKQVGLRHKEGERWAAEHGNCFDPFNDTGPDEIKIEQVLPQVAGKAMTYAYARDERNQELKKGFKLHFFEPSIMPERDLDDDWDLLDLAISWLARQPPPAKYLVAVNNLLRTLVGIHDVEEITQKKFSWVDLLFPHLDGLKTLWSIALARAKQPILSMLTPWEPLTVGILARNTKEHAHPYNLIVLKHYNIHPLEFDRATSSSLPSEVLARILADAVQLLTGADEAALHEGPYRMQQHGDLFVYITFVAARLNMIRRIAKDVKEQNSDHYKIYMPLPSSKVDNCFVIPYELKNPICPMPQLKLPLRVLVHSHTHAPVVIQIKLRHKSSVEKEEGYRDKAFIEVDKYDTNREPETSGYRRSFDSNQK